MTEKVTIKNNTPEIKEVELEIIEVESDAFIVKVDGWRIRIYFEEGYKQTSNKVKAKYTGDIENIHTVEFKTLAK